MSKQYTVQAPDGKTITLEGPEGASQGDIIQQAQKLYTPQPSLADRQSQSKAAFEANQPESHLGMNLSASTLWDELKKRMGTELSGTVGPPGNQSQVSFSPDVMMPGNLESPTPIQAVGNAWQQIKGLIPSAQRAGANLEKIREAAKDMPVDLSKAYNVIQRAKELEASAHGPISLGMSKVEQALQPMRVGEEGLVNPPAIKYPQSFDIASAAKSPSVLEKSGQTGMMQGQVKQFAKALQEANRDAAASVGMGDLFDSAMKEYRQAKTLAEKIPIIKKWVGIAALGAAGVGGARHYGLWNQLTGR